MDKIDQLIFIFPILLLIVGGIIRFQTNKNFSKANKALNKGEYEKALALYKEITTKNTNHKMAYYNMGLALEKLNKNEEAIKAYNECIRIDNNFINAYNNKLPILKKLGKKEDVLKTYDEIIRFCKEIIKNQEMCKVVYYVKGNFLSELNRYEEALIAYDEAIKIDPNYEDAFRGKGIILDNKLGKYEDALKVYDEIIRINKNHSGNYLNKGIILGMLGKNEKAIESFNKALETYDEWAKIRQNQETLNASGLNKGTIYYFKASTYAFMNNTQETINNLKEAIKIDNKQKEEAKKDKNFDKIRNLDEFRKIVGE